MANSARDYYDVLGVSRGASEEDIKKAYKKLAREHHPDMVKDDAKHAAEARFKEINQAYQVLKDPQKRKMYDQVGHAGFNASAGASAGGFGGAQGQWGPFTYSYSNSGGSQEGFDPFDIFEEIFGFRGFGGQRSPQKGKNLYYEMRVDFVDILSETEKEISVESGKIKIKIPKGARDGTELRFAGRGMPGADSLPSGDLFITLRIVSPKEFQRVGDDLVCQVTIGFAEAALGTTIEVPVVDTSTSSGVGSAKLKIPAGTQSHTQFRLSGKGIPRLRGHGAGSVIAQVFVEISKSLSRKQKQLLEQYIKL